MNVFVTEVVASLSDLIRYPVYKNVRPNETHTICLKLTWLIYPVPKIFRQTFLGVS